MKLSPTAQYWVGWVLMGMAYQAVDFVKMVAAIVIAMKVLERWR